MAENKIYEITQMMSDNRVIRGDVNQAASMIRAMLSEKYITPINRAIATENKRARKNPTREVRLLDALKPFVDHKSHDAVDKTIDALHMFETLRGLTAQVPQPKRHVASMGLDASQREDGVYDVDERCMEHRRAPNLMPIFAIMALALMSQSE